MTTGVTIHGFSYKRLDWVGVPSGSGGAMSLDMPIVAERVERARQAYIDKIWQQDLVRWDEEVKPDSIARNLALAEVDVDSLDLDGLVNHLEECLSNMAEMAFRHHMFSASAGVAAGKTHFLRPTGRGRFGQNGLTLVNRRIAVVRRADARNRMAEEQGVQRSTLGIEK